MSNITLKSGQSVYDAVDMQFKHFLKLDSNEKALRYQTALVGLEREYYSRDGALSSETLEKLKEGEIVNTINGRKIQNTSFMQNIHPNVSPFVLLWLKITTQNEQWYLSELFVFSYYFYATHPRHEILTLEWIMDRIGIDRVIDTTAAFYMTRDLEIEIVGAANNTNADKVHIYDQITQDEFYTFKGV